MRAFSCGSCDQLVFFENSVCLRCQATLGFDPVAGDVVVVDPTVHGLCSNRSKLACNWLVAPGDPTLCRSCRLTRTLPAGDDATTTERLAAAEAAKRRLVYQLDDLGLPVVGWMDGAEGRLAFDLLSSRAEPVTTGHADGVITIDLAESDDAHRERIRSQLDEPYRTMLGHLRHEIGHYYWPILVERSTELLDRGRLLFGDERADYAQALNEHYDHGPAADWPATFVSAYAAAHPWEDWAETFAHYLHIRDTLQTVAAWGVAVRGPLVEEGSTRRRDLAAMPASGPVDERFAALLDDWLPLTYALNAVNRSMGRDDLYPFVLRATAVGKLAFVHELVVPLVSLLPRAER